MKHGVQHGGVDEIQVHRNIHHDHLHLSLSINYKFARYQLYFYLLSSNNSDLIRHDNYNVDAYLSDKGKELN